jgi:hypothetical protein
MISGVETILFDVIVGVVGWRYLLKPYIADRQARAIAEEHALYGIEDHDHELHESIRTPVTTSRWPSRRRGFA